MRNHTGLRELEIAVNQTSLELLSPLVSATRDNLTCIRLGSLDYARVPEATLWRHLAPVLENLTAFQWDPLIPVTWGMYEDVAQNYFPNAAYLARMPKLVTVELGKRCIAPGTLVDAFAAYPQLESIVLHIPVPIAHFHECQKYLEFDQWRTADAVQDIATFVLLAPSLRRLRLVPEWLEPSTLR